MPLVLKSAQNYRTSAAGAPPPLFYGFNRVVAQGVLPAQCEGLQGVQAEGLHVLQLTQLPTIMGHGTLRRLNKNDSKKSSVNILCNISS